MTKIVARFGILHSYSKSQRSLHEERAIRYVMREVVFSKRREGIRKQLALALFCVKTRCSYNQLVIDMTSKKFDMH